MIEIKYKISFVEKPKYRITKINVDYDKLEECCKNIRDKSYWNEECNPFKLNDFTITRRRTCNFYGEQSYQTYIKGISELGQYILCEGETYSEMEFIKAVLSIQKVIFFMQSKTCNDSIEWSIEL